MASRIITTPLGKISIVESSGKAMPILFIHGNSSCKEVFKHQFSTAIGEKYHCIAMDLPGHGQSDDASDPEQGYTIPGYADIAIAVMDSLNIKSYTVFGWSLGGHIGIEMLSRDCNIKGLLISGTPPIGTDPIDMAAAFKPNEHMAFTGQEVLSEEQANQYAHATCGSDAQYEDFLGEAVRRTDGRARRIMMEAAIRGEGANQKNVVMDSDKPLAIVNGADEAMINNDYLNTIKYKNLWQDKIHLIDGAGHAPFWESSCDFNILLGKFVRFVGNSK